MLITVLIFTVLAIARSANIVVIGATGNLGSVIVKRALAMGHDITAVIRDRSKMKLKFEQFEIASMHTIVADTSIADDDNLEKFVQAFTGILFSDQCISTCVYCLVCSYSTEV